MKTKICYWDSKPGNPWVQGRDARKNATEGIEVNTVRTSINPERYKKIFEFILIVAF